MLKCTYGTRITWIFAEKAYVTRLYLVVNFRLYLAM